MAESVRHFGSLDILVNSAGLSAGGLAARDLSPFGITVNAVNPAATETRMVSDAVERARAAGGAAAERAEKLRASAQHPDDVARLIAALCLEDAAAITGRVFLVARDRLSLLRPLDVDQETTLTAPTVDAVLCALRGFRLPPLDEPY